jgi:hypothetical protein
MAGCQTEDVLAAIGLKFTDVSLSDSGRRRPSSRTARSRPNPSKPPAKPPSDKKPASKIVATYRYTDEHAQLLYEVVRLDPKSFRQRRPDPANPGEWLWNMEGVRRVPYRLHELVAADKKRPIWIPEGEKDVDNLSDINFLATTNPGGAGKWDKLDPAAVRACVEGHPVVLLQDNDTPGLEHVQDVARQLHGIAKSIRILELPNLPPKGDVSDWLAAGGTREQLIELAKATPEWKPGPGGITPPPATTARPARRTIVPYVPFPSHTLAGVLHDLVNQHAEAIGCDAAIVALPALAAVAAAIGNTRRVGLTNTWKEPAIVWAAVVARSGERKSPGFRPAMLPLVDGEQRFREAYDRKRAEFDRLDVEEAAWAARPVPRRILTDDVTIEALAVILRENSRGLLNAREELDDFFQGLVRYKGASGGSDRARWLKLSNGDPLVVDRKTGDPSIRNIFVPMATTSICGTIQPVVLANALDPMARASGMAARFLLAWPARRKRHWTEVTVSEEVDAAYARVIDRLLDLPMTTDAKGRPTPLVLTLGPGAKAAWTRYFNDVQDQVADAEPDIAAVLSKLEGYAARFALIHHLTTEVAEGRDGTVPVAEESMKAGVELAKWFANEARRIYTYLAESEEERGARDLVDLIRGRGGRITTRDLQRARSTQYRTADEAQAALDGLVSAGFGAWDEIANPRGGWIRCEFVLNTDADTDTCDTCPDPDPGVSHDAEESCDTPAGEAENSAGNEASVTSVSVGPDGCDELAAVSAEAEPDPEPASVSADSTVALDVEGEL